MNIEKLPKWAQAHIRKIERERSEAINKLNSSLDKQTPSDIYYEDMVCAGEKKGPSTKRFYIQSYKITIKHDGVELEIICRDGCIYISWGDDKYGHRDVAFIPWSYQQARLVSKENMR